MKLSININELTPEELELLSPSQLALTEQRLKAALGGINVQITLVDRRAYTAHEPRKFTDGLRTLLEVPSHTKLTQPVC